MPLIVQSAGASVEVKLSLYYRPMLKAEDGLWREVRNPLPELQNCELVQAVLSSQVLLVVGSYSGPIRRLNWRSASDGGDVDLTSSK